MEARAPEPQLLLPSSDGGSLSTGSWPALERPRRRKHANRSRLAYFRRKRQHSKATKRRQEASLSLLPSHCPSGRNDANPSGCDQQDVLAPARWGSHTNHRQNPIRNQANLRSTRPTRLLASPARNPQNHHPSLSPERRTSHKTRSRPHPRNRGPKGHRSKPKTITVL